MALLTRATSVALVLASALLAAGCRENTIAAGDWVPAWNDGCPVWSADGTKLAFGRRPLPGAGQPGVYVWNGRTVKRVFLADAQVLGWRGRSLVIRDQELLTLLDVASGRERVLFDLGFLEPGMNPEASVAPVGGRAAMVGSPRHDLEPGLLVLRPNHRLVLRRKGVVVARWSPRGALAYSDLDRLVVLRWDGRPLVHRPGSSALAWSPDSRLLAFDRPAPGLASDIWILDLRDGTTRRVTHADPGAVNVPAAWTADGRTIVEQTSEGGGVAEIDLDGDVLHRLPSWGGATPGTGVRCPSASRDGRVAFVRIWDDAVVPTSSVYVSPRDLGDATPLR